MSDSFPFKTPSFKAPSFAPPKLPKMRTPKISIGGNYSSREPLPAKVKNEVKERVKKKYGRLVCEQCGIKPRCTLEYHHINMKNSDNKASNILLLCPNHHGGKHSRSRRKFYRTGLGGTYYSRLVKKKTKKKGTRQKRTTNQKFFDGLSRL